MVFIVYCKKFERLFFKPLAISFFTTVVEFTEIFLQSRVGRCNGKTPRNNQVQNKQVKRVVVKYKLSKAEQKELHKIISHEGGGFWDVDAAAEEIVNNRK